MEYAKINENTVIKFPYTIEDLITENPYSLYDNRYDVAEWYKKTNESLETKSIVVPVIIEETPIFDETTHYVILQAEPKFINNLWMLCWDIIEKTSILEKQDSSDINLQ